MANRAELVRQWKSGTSEYRLLKRASLEYYSHNTVFVLEHDEKDSLGAPKWVSVYEWIDRDVSATPDHDRALSALAKILLQDELDKIAAARRAAANVTGPVITAAP